jgi:hypothetical protein
LAVTLKCGDLSPLSAGKLAAKRARPNCYTTLSPSEAQGFPWNMSARGRSLALQERAKIRLRVCGDYGNRLIESTQSFARRGLGEISERCGV